MRVQGLQCKQPVLMGGTSICKRPPKSGVCMCGSGSESSGIGSSGVPAAAYWGAAQHPRSGVPLLHPRPTPDPLTQEGSTLPAEQPDNPAGRPPCWSRSRASTHFSGTRIKQPRRHAPDPGSRAGGGTRTCHPGTPEADRQPSSQARPPAVGGGRRKGRSFARAGAPGRFRLAGVAEVPVRTRGLTGLLPVGGCGGS